MTYPKRAKGLVKNGRAEFVNDHEIRLLAFRQNEAESLTDELCPTVDEFTEDKTMKNIIEFNAREFKFDNTCEQNVGTRMLVTDFLDRNTEIFEIGDWNWSWTQICCEKTLLKNTDYVFRFAVTGGFNNTNDALLQLWIKPDKSYEDRYTYMLANSLYKPNLSKKLDNDLLRVYEIQFNTGESEAFEFVFVSQHAVARIMPAYELSAYENLEDMTGQQKMQELSENNSYNASSKNHGFAGNISLDGAVISGKMLNKIMELVTTGCNISLNGAVIGDDDDEPEDTNDNFKFSHFEKIAEHFDKKFGNMNTDVDNSADIKNSNCYNFDYNKNGVSVSIEIDFDNDDYNVNVDWDGNLKENNTAISDAIHELRVELGVAEKLYKNNAEKSELIHSAIGEAVCELSNKLLEKK